MKTISIIILIVGVIVTILGIRATNAIHSHNMAIKSGEAVQNDTIAILIGICGFMIVVVGFTLFIQPRKKNSS